MRKNNKIYLKTWLKLRPYNSQTSTDLYYLKLSNKVKLVFAKGNLPFLERHLSDDDIDLLACFLTAYLEDLVSETNIWNAFVRSHKDLYHKPVPFYESNDYFEEEINGDDISFLIWYFLNLVQDDIFISPFIYPIVSIADDVMELFEEAWDYAPANTHLRSFFNLKENEEDFYEARLLIDTILFQSYLFYPDTGLKMLKLEMSMIEHFEMKMKEGLLDTNTALSFLKEAKDKLLHSVRTKLLAFSGKEWASVMMSSKKTLSKDFANMTKKVSGYFFYKGQDEKNVFLEHIASGMKFNLTKKSFDYGQNLTEIDNIIQIGIVRWRDEWWLSGFYIKFEFDANLVLDEKKSIKSRLEVSFLDPKKETLAEDLKLQLEIFKEFNNGSLIAFMPEKNIKTYLDKAIQFFNDSLNLTSEQISESLRRGRNDGYFPDDKADEFLEGDDTGLVFFNSESGFEIMTGLNSAFPLPNNPYFIPEESSQALISLFFSPDSSAKLAMYCFDNCRNELPFFEEDIWQGLDESIDFLLRFWKDSNYFSINKMTFVGE